MIEVRTKDKIFIAILIPVALAVGLVYFGRQPAVKTRTALRAESAQLPDAQMFPMEKRQLQARLEEAKQVRTAVQAEKPPAICVKGDPAASASARQDAALAVLTAVGARIVRAEPVKDPQAVAEDGSHVMPQGGVTLQASGVRPVPEAVRVMAEATYPQMTQALRNFAQTQAAVIPESVSLTTTDKTCRWEMTLWL